MEIKKCGEVKPGEWVAFGGRATTKKSRPPVKARMVLEPRGVCKWYIEGDDERPVDVTRTGTKVWVGPLSELS